MSDLAKLSPTALAAAMKGGTEGWGRWGSSRDHVRYCDPSQVPPRSRRKCQCGCGKRSTHHGCANGITLMTGCELAVASLGQRRSLTLAPHPRPMKLMAFSQPPLMAMSRGTSSNRRV